MTASLARAARRTAACTIAAALATAGAITFAGATPLPHKHPVATYNAAAAKLVPASIKAKSKTGGLVEAFDATYPPDEFLAGNHTTIIGWNADLGKALAITLGLKFNPKNVTFANIIPRLQSGAVDIGNSSFTDNISAREAGQLHRLLRRGRGVLRQARLDARAQLAVGPLRSLRRRRDRHRRADRRHRAEEEVPLGQADHGRELPDPDRGQQRGRLGPPAVRLRGLTGRALHRRPVEGRLQGRRQGDQRRAVRDRDVRRRRRSTRRSSRR